MSNCPSWTLLTSDCMRGWSISRVLVAFQIESCVRFKYCRTLISDGISFQIVWRYFSPEMYKNFHSGTINRTSSPWIRRQVVSIYVVCWENFTCVLVLSGEILIRCESVLHQLEGLKHHLVDRLSENYKVGVSVCVFGVIFQHTWGTRIEVLGPLAVTFWDGTEVFFPSPYVLCVVTTVLIYSILMLCILVRGHSVPGHRIDFWEDSVMDPIVVLKE